MKQPHERVEEGLHPIENEKRPRAVAKKRGGLRLKAKYHRRVTKVLASFSAAAVLCLGVFGVNALFFQDTAPNVVDEGFVTVAYDLPTDGSTPDAHTALENIGYMNTRLMGQDNYYNEMHGLVDTMIKQEVSTYKQFSDDVLIQTDITTSSMVNSARQFCYVGDRVLWRDAAGGPSTYNGVDTVWKDGEPYGNTLIEDFKKRNGLPGTSFSVYVINEETLLGADPVVVNADGTYTQTYYLDPATDKAPAYYVNQMMFTGGLTALPSFEQITVTYTFDSTWQVLQSVISETYTATMGVSVGCTASYTTNYEYDTEKALSDAYDTYFKDYADKPATGAPDGETVTAAACLSNAFAPVLSGPVTFSLDLAIDGASVSGLVYVDAADMADMELRAQLGNLYIGYADGQIRLAYGDGVKVGAGTEELLALLRSFLPEGGNGGISLDTDELLAQLGGGDFAVSDDGRSATLDSTLGLMGVSLPVHFEFLIAEDGTISLGHISADISLDGTEISARLAYSDESVPVKEGEYADLIPYAETVLGIMDSDVLAVSVDYAGNGFSVGGTLNVNISDLNDLSAQGTLTLSVGGAQKKIGIAYTGGYAYIDLDGVKIRANAEEAIALVMQFIGGELPAVGTGDFALGDLLTTLLSDEFASNISLSEKENVLEVVLAGNELFKALGVDLGGFALGKVELSVSDGALSVNALGAQLSVTAGKEFSVDTEGYTDILPMVNELIALFGNENLQASVNYAAGDLTAEGTIRLNVNTLAAAGELTLGYKGKTKAVGVIYGDGELGLDIDGIKVKANVEEAVSLIADLLGAEGGLSAEEDDLLGKLLSLDFGSLIGFENESSVVVKGTELLKAIGIDFALGDVRLTVKDGALTAEVLGATATVTGAEAFEAVITDEYTDILPYADALIAFFTDAEYLRAEIAYAAGELSAEGYVNLSLKELAVQGEVTIDYRGAAIAVGLIYQDGALYLNVNGLKVKANAEEAISLVADLLGADGKGFTQEETDILETLFSLDLGKLIGLDDTNALTVNVKGTELLKAFGIDFELGDVSLTVSSEEIAANVLGAQLAVAAGKEFSVDTEGYTDILPMAETILGIVADGGVDAQVQFAAGQVSLLADVSVSLENLAVKGSLTVSYTDGSGSAAKKIDFAYGEEGYVYLTLEGAKLKLNAADAAGLVSSAIGTQDGSDVSEILKKLFSLDLGEIIRFKSETSAVIGGTQLLEALGVDFALGDVALTAENGKLTAEVLGEDTLLGGLRVTLAAGSAFAVDASEYAGHADITPVLDTVLAVMENKALALSGTLSVGYKDFAASVSVQNGTVSWKDGFRLSLDLIVTAGETAQKIGVYADETRVTIVYGSVGVDLVYDELYQVGNAFEAAYERISAILSNYVKGAQIPATLGELSALAGAGAAVTDLLAGLDIPQIIDGVSFGAPEKGGVASVAYGNIRAELFVSRGAVSVDIGKVSLGEAAFSGSLTAGVSDGAVTQPSGSYMTAESLCELLDFVGAAAATLSSNDVRISFNDSVSVNADGSAKFEIDGELVYHAGNAGETFFTLDTAAQSLVVNPEAYVYFTLWLDEVAADGTDLYLQFWMFDYEQDGELDFFISLSKYQPEDSRYKPLNFAVSASDLMTIAASGVSLMEDTLADFLTTLGFPEETTAALFETLDSYFVSKWLSDDEQGQFGAVGGMLASTLGIKDAVEGILGDVSDAITGETVLADMPFDYYLKELGVSSENGETVFTVTLDSDLVYGGEGLDDLTVTLRKNGEAGSSFLSGISVANIYGAGNADKTSVNFDIGYEALTLGYTESGITLSAGDAQVASLNYADYSNYMFEGADELLKSIALSATHKTDDGYALNGNFFISGSAEVVIDLTLFEIPAATVTVNGLSVSVDENGELTINASITFPKVIIAINEGGTTDITVKQGMVYLRRTIGSDVKYRVLTLESFFADIMDHVIFMFNFSDTVADAMKSGGSSETTPETDDYGTVLSDVLSSYSYRQGEQGSEWVLNFNGSALTGGVLGDMQLTLASSNYAGTDNVLRTLNFRTSLSVLKVDATLTFHNPCDISDGTQDPTADLSDQIPDLYTVTIIAPCALGPSWEKNEDGTYSVSVQMFADSAISLVYGENTYTFRVTGENCVFDLTAIEGLPQNMLWEEGTFEYTADDSSIRVPLAPDTVTYRSSGVNFTLGGAENVSETTVEFDGTYTLETPAAEGYTFLGWYVLDENGNPVRVTEISYSVVGGANTTVEALWASNIVFESVETSDKQRDWVAWHRTFSANVTISGGALCGAYADTEGISVYTKYTFTLKGTAYGDDIGYVEGDGFLASASCSKDGNSAANRKYEISVELIYSCGGNEVGNNFQRVLKNKNSAPVTGTLFLYTLYYVNKGGCSDGIALRDLPCLVAYTLGKRRGGKYFESRARGEDLFHELIVVREGDVCNELSVFLAHVFNAEPLLCEGENVGRDEEFCLYRLFLVRPEGERYVVSRKGHGGKVFPGL